jgi:hypothetical protein
MGAIIGFDREQREEATMKVRYVVLVALAAAVTLTSVAAAGPAAAKQRVAITSNGVLNATAFGEFVFTPLQAGALKRDTGTETSHWSERVVMRDGQRVTVQNYVTTRKGKRGSFVVRSRIEYVDAGNGYLAGTNTWKFVRGTGQYAQITGGGRGGDVVDSGRWTDRYEGFLTLP